MAWILRVSEALRDLDHRANKESDRRTDHENTDRDEKCDQKHENGFLAKRCDPPEATDYRLCLLHNGSETHPSNGR